MPFKITTTFIVLFAALLSGCATTGDVVPLGKDAYMVGTQVFGGMNWTEVKAKSVVRANEFCQAKGLQMEMTQDIKTSGARGWTPQGSEVTFKCVDK